MATILRVPFFSTDCRAKASDGYNTTGAFACHRLQGIKPVMATIQLLPFFPLIAGAKASDGYNTTGAIFFATDCRG